MRIEDLKTEVNEGILILSGERKFDEPANGVEYHRVERVAGKFSRSFYLPQTVKHDDIKATYRDGILEVKVPKADEAKTDRYKPEPIHRKGPTATKRGNQALPLLHSP